MCSECEAPAQALGYLNLVWEKEQVDPAWIIKGRLYGTSE